MYSLSPLSRKKIAAELLQNLGQAENNMLFKLVCNMYEPGDIPNNYMVNKTITVLKKVGAEKFENYRTISIMTHASKILTTMIHRRIEILTTRSVEMDTFSAISRTFTFGSFKKI